MQTTETAAHRRHWSLWTTGLAALSLLALPLLVAASAEAQRGGHGGGRGGYSGGPRGSGHHGGSYRGHRGGHRGHYGGYAGRYGSSGRHGYGGHRGYGGGYGHRGGHSYGYGGRYGHGGRYGYGRYSSHRYGGFYGYFGYRPGYWGGYAYYSPRVYGPPYVAYGDPYVSYGDPAYYYDAGPRTSVYLDYDLTQDPAARFPVPEAEPQTGEAYAQPGGATDARLEPARIDVRVEPGDASVYLDGRFVGLAAELPETLLIEPGEHLLEVVRPGFASQEVELAVAPGEEIEVDTRLEPAGGPR